MGFRVKTTYLDILLGILVLLLTVKLLWTAVEIIWLPTKGVNHAENSRVKPLYYKVKIAADKKVTPIRVEKKPVGSIKDIQLLAIYNASDVTVVTVIYKGKTKVLGRGDVINGFTLEGAGSDYATFSKNGKAYRVDLIKSKQKGIGSIKPVPFSATKKPPKEFAKEPEGEIVDAGDHKIIDRSLFDHYVKNMNDIYKNIGIKEIKKGNQIDGFQITFVRRGTPFSKLGIKRGDILKSVNGEELTSYNAAFEAYKAMNDAQNVTVVIQRGNKTMELEYEIN